MSRFRNFLVVSALAACCSAHAAIGESKAAFSGAPTWTQWADDYAKALKMSQATGKPLLLAFTGSGWCPWSMKMEEDILSRPEFSAALRENVLFVRIDFPEKDSLPIERKTQYFGLKKRYAIQELPTLVLVDSSGDEIIKLGYMPVGSREFAGRLTTALADYRQLKAVVGTPSLLAMKGDEIQELYKKANTLSVTTVRQQILEAGLKSDQDAFFLMEQYEHLLTTHALNDPTVLQLRKKITARDPVGNKGIQFKLATVEFTTLARQLKKKEDPQRAIAPLVHFLQNFGSQDSENHWRVEMMIAQFLFSKNKVALAVTHAKNSYEQAPEEYRREIAQSLEYLRSKAP